MSRPECWAGVSLERRGVCACAREEAHVLFREEEEKAEMEG